MVLNKLKPGMTVYYVKRAYGMSAYLSKWSTWPVYIKEIDEENKRVLASWNYNEAKWYNERTWSKWRMSTPKD